MNAFKHSQRFWILKFIIKLALSHLKISYSFLQKLNISRHGRADSINYSLGVLNNHLDNFKISHNELKGKNFLEIGPGDGIINAIVIGAFGGKTILIDNGSYINQNLDHYKRVIDKLSCIFPQVNFHIGTINSFDDILNTFNIEYKTNGVNSILTVQDESIDYIFSQAVFEHIDKDIVAKYIDEMHRCLCFYGKMSHSIDFKDHLAFSLNHLRFPSKIWESKLIKGTNLYLNRLRSSEFLHLFENAGFKLISSTHLKWNSYPLKRSLFAKEFSDFSEIDFLIHNTEYVCSKE